MSREVKKKPGEFEVARLRHLSRQAAQDAISALKRGETVDVQALKDGKMVTVRVQPFSEGRPSDHSSVLCLVNHQLWVKTFFYKDGRTVHDSCGGLCIPESQIYGMVSV